MGSQRVGHDWATSLLLFTFMHWRRKWQPTPVFLPGESQGRRSLVGCRLWGRTESDMTEATQQQQQQQHAWGASTKHTACYTQSGTQQGCEWFKPCSGVWCFFLYFAVPSTSSMDFPPPVWCQYKPREICLCLAPLKPGSKKRNLEISKKTCLEGTVILVGD